MTAEARVKRAELAYRESWDVDDVRLAIVESRYECGNTKIEAVNVDTNVVFCTLSEDVDAPLPVGIFELRDWVQVNELAVTLVSIGIIESADDEGIFFRLVDVG
jgi:hypothetical protein